MEVKGGPESGRRRRFRPLLWTVAGSALVGYILLVLVAIIYRHPRRFDFTAERENTLSRETLSRLALLNQEVRVVFPYLFQVGNPQDDLKKQVLARSRLLLSEYMTRQPLIKMEAQLNVAVEGDGQAWKALCEKYDLGPRLVNRFIFISADGKVRRGVNPEELADYDKVTDPREKGQIHEFRAQQAFTAAISALINREKKRAYLVSDHRGPMPEDKGLAGLSVFREKMEVNGFELRPLSIRTEPRVPADCDLLMIVAPEAPFDSEDRRKVNEYLGAGGRLLAALGAGETGLEAVLDQWGIHVANGLMYQKKDLGPRSIWTPTFDAGLLTNTRHPITSPFSPELFKVLISYSRTLEPKDAGGMQAESLVQAGEKPATIVDQNKNGRQDDGEELLSKVLAAVAWRPKPARPLPDARFIDTRLVAIGESALLQNQLFQQYTHREFLQNCASWLVGREAETAGEASAWTERRIKSSPAIEQFLFWVPIFLFPGIAISLGCFIYLLEEVVMGPRTVALLAVVAAALTGYFWLFEREPDRPEIGPVFPRLSFTDLKEIELTAGQPEAPGASAGPVRLFKKEDGSWWIERPAVPAHIPRVESIAYSLVELQRIADLDLTQASTVFDPRGPEETARFRTRSGEEHRVEVGKDHPDPTFDLCYVKVDGRALFLTRKSFKKNLQSRLDDLRSRALFPIPRDQVAKLEVTGEEAAAKSLHREASGDFRFDRPAPAPAGREKIARLLDDLNAWRVGSFIRDEPGDLAAFGLDHPRSTIGITGRDGVRMAVEVGSAAPDKGQVYVKWADRPFIMTAELSVVEGAERPAEQLYSEFVLQFGAEDITEISARFPSPGPRDFSLKRSAATEPASATSPGKKRAAPEGPAKWEIEEPGSAVRPADPDRMAVLTSALKYLAIKRYLSRPAGEPAAIGAPPPGTVAVEIRSDTGARHSLLFQRAAPSGEEGAEGLQDVTSGDEPFLFRVITRAPDQLAHGAAWFRNRRISYLAADGLREFEVTILEPTGQQRTFTIGRPADQWMLDVDFPEQAEKFDEKLARKVAALLARDEFLVEEWAAPETDLAAQEIDDARFKIRITITTVNEGFQGFTRLYLGQAKMEGGVAVSYWARVNEPGLEKLPFLLDAPRARVILDLVEHLKEITKE